MRGRAVDLGNFPESRRLDVQVLNTIFGCPLHKIYPDKDIPDWLYWIPSGKPQRTHKIDEVPVPKFSGGEAFRLIDRLCTSGGPQVIIWRSEQVGGKWCAEFSLAEHSRDADDENLNVAICLAALRWVADLSLAGVAREGSDA